MSKDGGQHEARRMTRKNMFLSAVIETPCGWRPARVRNMCVSGAMVEAAELPEDGSLVRLRRGSLQVSGRVAWRGDGRCGLELATAIDVDDWLSPPSNARQADADLYVFGLQSGHASEFSPRLSVIPPEPITMDAAKLVASLLQAVGDQFARDPVILATRSLELQAFDVAVQTLEAMAMPARDASGDRLCSAASACWELLQTIANRSGPPSAPE